MREALAVTPRARGTPLARLTPPTALRIEGALGLHMLLLLLVLGVLLRWLLVRLAAGRLPLGTGCKGVPCRRL